MNKEQIRAVKWKLSFHQKTERHKKWMEKTWLPHHLKFLREYYLAINL